MGRACLRHPLHLLLQAFGCAWFHRARRTALYLDRARHDGEPRLDHTAFVWKGVVLEAAAFLLGRWALLQMVWRERSRRANAERDFCAARHSYDGLARIAPLRQGNCALAVAPAADNRGHDWLLARCGDGYALQRDAHHCHGLRRRRGWPYPRR